MVAPVDSKVELLVEGETITLRLNFRSISLLEEAGLDLFGPPVTMTLARSATICRCLSVQEHPELSSDEAMAIVTRAGQDFALAVLDLITRFGGKSDEEREGNALMRTTIAARPPRKASSSSGAKRATNRTPSGSKRRAASS